MPERTADLISLLLARTPEWVRRDFAAPSEQARRRAEEALAATIANAARAEGDDIRAPQSRG